MAEPQGRGPGQTSQAPWNPLVLWPWSPSGGSVLPSGRPPLAWHPHQSQVLPLPGERGQQVEP